MRRYRSATATIASALTFACAVTAPARADTEVETIDCAGWIAFGALTTPDYASNTNAGVLTCTLGHGGDTGYAPYATFTSNVDAQITNRAVAAGVNDSTGLIHFNSSSRAYTLAFSDRSYNDMLVLANPDDSVHLNSPPSEFQYHIRWGHIAAGTPCSDCPTVCDVRCISGSLGVRFIGEYVHDLPVIKIGHGG